MALARLLVVDGRVGHRVAVGGALVDLGAVRDAGLVEGGVERGDLLGRVAAVVVGVAEVELGARARPPTVRALRIVGDEPAAVEAGERGDPVRVRGRDPQRRAARPCSSR